MKKFFINIAIFAVVIVAIDFCFGRCMNYLMNHANGGGYTRQIYISKKSSEDILLFGSSRMSHHYVPKIIEDSLDMTCYNCGQDGNGIILMYGYLKMILERYTPKMIIYDFASFDLYQQDDDNNKKYISILKLYCDNPDVMNVITAVSANEKIKLKSNLYRYNTKWMNIISSALKKKEEDINNGYIPLKNVMDYEPKLSISSNLKVDSVKLDMLQMFIETCIDYEVPIVFTMSPRYKGATYGIMYPEICDICKQYSIPFWYYFADSSISETKTMFQDQTHMNETGAEKFTKELIPSIRALLKEREK